MKSILLTDSERFPIDAQDEALIGASGAVCISMSGHNETDLLAYGRDAEAVLVYSANVSAAVLGGLHRCRVLARCGAGYDNIDVAAARERGIEVTYVPAYGSIDVAEHALALILACSRRLCQSNHAVRAGGWPAYRELGTMRRLHGQTLGLVGFGRIARCLAERASALGLAVLAHDPLVPPRVVRELGVTPVSASLLLTNSDVVSLHLPLKPETHGWLNPDKLASMKSTAILVNTSRGGLIDEQALIAALLEGRLAGAGLDVFENEPLKARSGLTTLDNVILTPHSAAFTEEALAEVRKTALNDALAVLDGRTPSYPVPTGI